MAHKRTSDIQLVCVVSLYLAIFTILVSLFATAQSSPVSVAPATSMQQTAASNTITIPIFLPAVNYDSGGTWASSVAVQDVNGDRKPDIITANSSSATVDVLLGNGDGTFRPAVGYDSGGFTAGSLAVADVDGDGRLDLVVTTCSPWGPGCGSGLVGVLLGNGDGTFRLAATYGTGSSFSAGGVAVADLNGDGKPDLIVTNNGGANGAAGLSVLLGNGDGTFQPAVTHNFGGYGYSVAVADVNQDGNLDVVVTNLCSDSDCNGAVAVLLGKGDGTFQPSITYASGGYEARSVAVADANGDGKLDLLVANNCIPGKCPEGAVGVLLGNGDGTFQSAVTYPIPYYSEEVAVADVNGDGKPDLLVPSFCVSLSNCAKGAVNILLGNGDGTFQAALTYDSGGLATISAAVADVNRDGKPDVMVLNFCANNVCTAPYEGEVDVLLNNTPFCTTPPVVTLSVTPASLWPPNGKMVPVTVSGTIADTGCTIETAAYAVTDEYGQAQPAGPLTLGPGGDYSFSIFLQASRLGTDLDGRLYTVTVSAINKGGTTGSQSGTLVVPHDQRH